MKFGDFTSNTEMLRLMTMEYTIERDGHIVPEPVLQLFARDATGERRLIEVEGFYPYFYISESEFESRQDDLLDSTHVREIVARSEIVSMSNKIDSLVSTVTSAPKETLQGEPLVKIVMTEPKHVRDLREHCDETWEADVFFTNRFKIDTGIKRGFTIPTGSERVHVDAIEATEDIPDVMPRTVTIDIEVWSGGEFPNTEHAEKPITSYTLHDSYTDEFMTAVLEPNSSRFANPNNELGEMWSQSDDIEWEYPSGVDESMITVDVYESETTMLDAGNQWIIDKNPDLLTGWNSSRNDIGNGFDYPYWINRCENINVWSFTDLSPVNQVFTKNSGTPVIKGRVMFDMLQAYKKTQIHEKPSYALEAIAQDELGYGKEDIESLDEGWMYEPEKFIKYNIRDVGAVVDIESEKGVLDMYDHIQHVTGTPIGECADSNIGIIDILFLRQAYDNSYALPTSTKPNRDWYYGGKVYNPIPGKHENVVYPDLASLYPYLMWSLNVSPETIYESMDEVRENGLSEDDVYRAFIDTRDDSVKRTTSPKESEIYYAKPDVKKGFVREIITQMTDMKYEYKKDEYSDEKYAAVKRIVNSLYGTLGDSHSFGTGFRLYDWRLAETITLAGQSVLNFTSNSFIRYLHENGYEDAKRIGGDTDSVMSKIPSLDVTPEEIQDDYEKMQNDTKPEMPFFQAAQHVNHKYDEYMSQKFWIDDPSMHKMEVEIESYADALFFLQDMDANSRDKGVKKRYAQLITWDDGEVIENPSPDIKGFESIRSDAAPITARTQERVFDIILSKDNPKESVTEYLCDEWDSAKHGEIDISDIGIPSKINKSLDEYGGPDKNGNYSTPQPHIRGARYANTHVPNENISSGDKPVFYYVDRVGYPYPDVFVYDKNWDRSDTRNLTSDTVKELGTDMDAIAVTDVRNMPVEIKIDYKKMAIKTIRDPLEDIIETMGWEFEDVTSSTSQTGMAHFM